MPNYRRAYQEGGTFFFTVVTYRRVPLLGDQRAIDLLHECFEIVRILHPFQTEALVVLPDHLHTIWTLPENDADFSVRWKKIKASFSTRFHGAPVALPQSMVDKGEKGIWQRRYWEHAIRDQQDFNRHCDYIRYNPVKHGLATFPSDWKASSFAEFVASGYYGGDWGRTPPESIGAMNSE